MAEAAKLLILGGTAEARALAGRAALDPRVSVITSLAGRTRAPARVPGALRLGGFGGPEGLGAYLRDQAIALLVDATHPFAATISRNAAAAAATQRVPRLLLLRPAWHPEPQDRWVSVGSLEQAAKALDGLGERIFLSVGRQGLDAFARMPQHSFLVRMIDPPEAPPPLARFELLLARGPFTFDAEAALLRDRRIAAVVSKNSGGEATYGKILAARDAGLPVVMVERPPPPEGETVTSVDQAWQWIERRLD